VLDDTGDLFHLIGKGLRVGDGSAGTVEDVLALVGSKGLTAGLAKVRMKVELLEAMSGLFPGEGEDLNGQSESAEESHDFGGVRDDDELMTGGCNDFFAEESSATALDEGESGSNLVGTVDGEVDVGDVVKFDEGDAGFTACLFGHARGGDAADSPLVLTDLESEGGNHEHGGGAAAEADDHSVAHKIEAAGGCGLFFQILVFHLRISLTDVNRMGQGGIQKIMSKTKSTVVMHTTKIDLSIDSRAKMIDLLNTHLAALSDLYSQTKQAHWNVKGLNFISLHELFDKLAGDLPGFVDEVAERAATLGGVALGTVRMAASTSPLAEYPVDAVDGKDHLKALIDRWGAYAALARAAIDTAGNAGDQDTADLFTQISRKIDMNLWFLESHLN